MSARRWVATAVIVAGAAAFPGAVSAAEGPSDSQRPQFVATASAQGVRFTYTVPKFAAVEEVADGGGPVTQSVLDAGGVSTSFASLPYPGENAIAFPGVVALFTGEAPPGYPLYASASDPGQPEQKVQDPSGIYSLTAQAEPTGTKGHAGLAGGQAAASAHSKATSSAVVNGLTAVATAETSNEGLTLGDGALRIGVVRSRSITKQTAEAEPHSETELVVEAATAGGLTLSYGPQGLIVGSQGFPLPVSAGLEQVNKALAPAHLAVRIVGPQAIVGGASAGVFEVVSRQPSPGPGFPEMVIRFRFGGATTAVRTGAAAGLPPADLPSGTFDPPPDTFPATPKTPVDPAAVAPSPFPSTVIPGLPSARAVPSAAGPAFASGAGSTPPGPVLNPEMPGPAPLDDQPGPAMDEQAFVVTSRPVDAMRFGYATFIAGGFLILALALVWRPRGVV